MSKSTSFCPNLLFDVEPPLRNSYAVLRHGQSLANVAKRIASNPSIACTEYGLSVDGQEQARKAGQDVVQFYQSNNEKFQGIAILTSDLLRAKQTAEAVRDTVQSFEAIPLYTKDIVVEQRFRERWFGDWDGTSDHNYHQVWKDDVVDSSHTNCGVESVDAVMNRATSAIREWDERLNDHFVVCVAHGDVLQILQTAFQKRDGTEHRSLEHLETAKLRPLELASRATG